jgi:large subunit ribosomal protein L23
MKHAGIIRRLQVTEKGTRLAAGNQYLLEVAREANKIEIRRAVETTFGVHVLAVNTQNHRGARHRLRDGRVARRQDWKRAVVTLKPGERIETV